MAADGSNFQIPRPLVFASPERMIAETFARMVGEARAAGWVARPIGTATPLDEDARLGLIEANRVRREGCF